MNDLKFSFETIPLDGYPFYSNEFRSDEADFGGGFPLPWNSEIERLLAPPVAPAYKGPRVVLLPGVLGSAIADRSLTTAQAREICEKNIGRLVSPSSSLYPCTRQPELLWGGIGSLHWLLGPTSWGQRMRSGNGFDNGGSVAPAGPFEIDLKVLGKRIEVKPYTALIKALLKAGADLYVFTYDWRLSCTHNAALLAREILKKWFGDVLPAEPLPSRQQITFIGHSMGGLVARYLLETQSNWAGLARRLITVGTPHLGAPQGYLHFTGKTFPFPRTPYYDWAEASLQQLASPAGSIGTQMLPGPIQTAVFQSMSSAAELMPVYNFVQGKGGPEAYRDTYRGLVHPPTGRSVIDIINNLRSQMVGPARLEGWLSARSLDYHFIAGNGIKTASGYDRGRNRVLTNSDGDGRVPRSSALPLVTSSTHLHLKTLTSGGWEHSRLCERQDVQAYILAALRDVAPTPAPGIQTASPVRPLGANLIQPDDFVAMAKLILKGKPPGVGQVLSVARLLAGDGKKEPLINSETQVVGTKLMLKSPPNHIVGREVFPVQSPRHGLFQYIWISSANSAISQGGMMFLPPKLETHELPYVYLVTFNPERLDKRYPNACTNGHHAEMQLVEWIEKQPESWRARLGTILIQNRSRKGEGGFSPCTGCCDDLAKFLATLKALQRKRGQTFQADAIMKWLTQYTYAGICPSHPTTKESLNMMYSRGWKLDGPGWTTPMLAPIVRRPVPAHAP